MEEHTLQMFEKILKNKYERNKYIVSVRFTITREGTWSFLHVTEYCLDSEVYKAVTYSDGVEKT
jgi:hypothetical protein